MISTVLQQDYSIGFAGKDWYKVSKLYEYIYIKGTKLIYNDIRTSIEVFMN